MRHILTPLNTFSDGATVISVDPKAGSVDKLYKKDFVEFRCHAEANPLPSYRWVHHSSRGSITLGHERTLKLSNLEYDDQVRLNVKGIFQIGKVAKPGG